MTVRAGFQDIIIEEAGETEEGDKIFDMNYNGTADDDNYRQHRSTEIKNTWDGLDDLTLAQNRSPEIKNNWDGLDDEHYAPYTLPEIYPRDSGDEYETEFNRDGDGRKTSY